MIEFVNVSKVYDTQHHQVKAVNPTSFTIDKGDIFGVIGHSGAGKSTLVRLINFLEVPSTGDVVINGTGLKSLKPAELRAVRKNIGMIFQGFNLMRSRTVFQNVAFPLKGSGLSNTEIQTRVTELLELVGLSDKAKSYPSQLSGGQQQRVAIARALANNPDILLCDEATSALDPHTTQSILELLAYLNRTLGITIVIITHEMNVIKEICTKVAIMDQGDVVEMGSVIDIFTSATSDVARSFIESTQRQKHVDQLIATLPPIDNETSTIVRLDFLGSKTHEAMLVRMCKDCDVEASILYAQTDIIQKETLGFMVIRIIGTNSQKALDYLNAHHVRTEVISHV